MATGRESSGERPSCRRVAFPEQERCYGPDPYGLPREGPGENGYAKGDTVEFGDPLHIPAPFDCQLDTTDFVVALLDDEEE